MIFADLAERIAKKLQRARGGDRGIKLPHAARCRVAWIGENRLAFLLALCIELW